MACSGLQWPALACTGLQWPALACTGPAVASTGPAVACTGLQWPPLGLQWPPLACSGLKWREGLQGQVTLVLCCRIRLLRRHPPFCVNTRLMLTITFEAQSSVRAAAHRMPSMQHTWPLAAARTCTHTHTHTSCACMCQHCVVLAWSLRGAGTTDTFLRRRRSASQLQLQLQQRSLARRQLHRQSKKWCRPGYRYVGHVSQ